MFPLFPCSRPRNPELSIELNSEPKSQVANQNTLPTGLNYVNFFKSDFDVRNLSYGLVFIPCGFWLIRRAINLGREKLQFKSSGPYCKIRPTILTNRRKYVILIVGRSVQGEGSSGSPLRF